MMRASTRMRLNVLSASRRRLQFLTCKEADQYQNRIGEQNGWHSEPKANHFGTLVGSKKY